MGTAALRSRFFFFFFSMMQDGEPIKWNEIVTPTYELAEKCLRTNYYGSKRMCEVLIPLLQLSDLPRIVNVSSNMGKLKVKSFFTAFIR